MLCGFLQHSVLELAARHREVRNMPQLAELVGGKLGNGLYQFLQITNQQLFLPVAIVFVAHSLRTILWPLGTESHALDCNMVWLLFVILFALVGANVQRKFGHAGWLCKTTCLLNVAQGLLIVTRIIINPNDHTGKNDEHAEPWAFPPGYLTTDESERGYWVNIFTSFSLFCYCYVPCFIATEAMQEMRDVTQMKTALWSSTLGMYLLYVMMGVAPVLAWGWDREYNLFSELKHDWVGRTANITLLLASGVDFVITAISMNQRVQQTMAPGFDVDDWSIAGCAKWFLYSLPSLFVSLLMLCFIPKLESLSGLMTAFVVPLSQIIGPATILLFASRQGKLGHPLSKREKAAIFFGFVEGTFMFVVGSMATIYSIFVLTDYSGNFFCEVVA